MVKKERTYKVLGRLACEKLTQDFYRKSDILLEKHGLLGSSEPVLSYFNSDTISVWLADRKFGNVSPTTNSRIKDFIERLDRYDRLEMSHSGHIKKHLKIEVAIILECEEQGLNYDRMSTENLKNSLDVLISFINDDEDKSLISSDVPENNNELDIW